MSIVKQSLSASSSASCGRRTLCSEGTFTVPHADYSTFGVRECKQNGDKPEMNTPAFQRSMPRGMWGTATSDNPFKEAAGNAQLDRGTLEWKHLPAEKWESEMKAQYVAKGATTISKRHVNKYYTDMSGNGVPSERDRDHGVAGKNFRGLGNTQHMQVPHSSVFPDL
mmetsp:Transcript_33755/g.46741  ORF Transcript_33755/g.46741 Transcript_33755/m.46741 type:complete len:167 (-) Transcript_33755:118-618(-)|eukprot:CAMPEP_0196587426 /NCGR_PEP_ID=MMETSP1081-20130531/57446_1 /TAXON_ID=36882 /ORGANISM="Pyramimonas amylifera, Strain CCMP720" /LENGTH=166 /DNA_ID=CAMNT_0041909611 /DNA_START=150 /DNA_END=650 /DNA_ORIENTATION=-